MTHRAPTLTRRLTSLLLVIALVNMVFPYGVLAGELDNKYVVTNADYDRVSGLLTDAGTAIETAQKGWPNGADTVIVASDAGAEYAAVASPLAAVTDAPVLIGGTKVPATVIAELDRLSPNQIFVVASGSDASRLSKRLAGPGRRITTLTGRNEFDVAYSVASEVQARSDAYRIVIAAPDDSSQLLMAAADAARTRSPLLLAPDTRLTSKGRTAITSLEASTALVVGTKGAYSDALVSELEALKLRVATVGGSTDTIAKTLYLAATEHDYDYSTTIVIGEDAAQSLSAPALSAKLGAPVVLSTSRDGSALSRDLLLENCSSVKELVVVGDTGSISTAGAADLRVSVSTQVLEDVALLDPAKRWDVLAPSIVSVSDCAIVTSKPIRLGDDGLFGQEVTANDYVVIKPYWVRPSGLYGRVTGVSFAAGRYTYALSQVPLGQIIKQGSLSTQQAAMLQNSKSVGTNRQNWEAGFEQELGFKIGPHPDTVVTKAPGFTERTSVSVTGDVKVGLECRVHMSLVNGQVETFEYWFEERARATVSISATGEFTVTNKTKKPLSTFKGKPIIVPIGGIPVVFLPVVDYYAYIEGSCGGTLAYGYTWTVANKHGARFADGVKTPIKGGSSPTWKHTAGTGVSAKADLKFVFAKFKFSLLVYGLAGPSVTVTGSVGAAGKISTVFSGDAVALHWTIDLKVVVSAEAGLSSKILPVEFSVTLGSLEWPVYHAEGDITGATNESGLVRLLSLMRDPAGPALSSNAKMLLFRVSSPNPASGWPWAQYVADIATGKIDMVAVGPSGTRVDATSYSMSGDGGRVASIAGGQVLVRDRGTRTTFRVDRSTRGVVQNGRSTVAKISANGNAVLFLTDATNLVDGRTSAGPGYYVRDLANNTTVEASVIPASLGTFSRPSMMPTTGGEYPADISANGRYVVWPCRRGTGPGAENVVMRRDLVEKKTEIVSRNASGGENFVAVIGPSISGNGRYVTFLGRYVSGRWDLWQKDMTTKTLRVVSLDGRNNAYGYAYDPVSSYDGRYVAFAALTPSGTRQIVVRDTTNRTTKVISSGLPADWSETGTPSISSDGSKVAFVTWGRRGSGVYAYSTSKMAIAPALK